jgi:L-lactate dehydrogenase complex protein LldF
VVKSKSMLTEECGLNPYLEARGVEVVDSDLGERIVQLRGEAPSHIVMPAIHLRTADVGDTFHAHLGTPAGAGRPAGAGAGGARAPAGALPRRRRGAHRRQLRRGRDGRLRGVHQRGERRPGRRARAVHVASMGIEKLLPRAEDLGVFLRLLARSGTGQASTVYASHVHGPRRGQALHLVLVDNGRSAQLGREGFWRSLKCIRCGACMNTCPVYRRSGGHSYGATIPGPIGAVLTPGIDLARYAALPFASTLCGSCTAVCPVKIDLDAQLYRWRQVVVATGRGGLAKRAALRAAGWLLARPGAFAAAGAAGRLALRLLPPGRAAPRGRGVGAAREVPAPPPQSFHAWYRARRGSAAEGGAVGGGAVEGGPAVAAPGSGGAAGDAR